LARLEEIPPTPFAKGGILFTDRLLIFFDLEPSVGSVISVAKVFKILEFC
jgi:hypothetical protein